MEGIIYKYTNRINNKVYIGQTINERKRYNEHKRAQGNSYFHNAINKYGGIENFNYEILYKGDESTLDEKEIYYITLYNSTDSKFGYNLDSGGNKNKHLSQETKIKISKANKGRLVGENNPMYDVHRFGKDAAFYGKHHSQETKDKMSKTRIAKELSKGKNNPFYGDHRFAGENNPMYGVHRFGEEAPMYGKHLSQEAKEKISKANKGRILGENNPRYHKGNLFEYNNQIYSSHELANLINCNYTTINHHVNKGETEFSIKGHLIKVHKKRDS